VTAVKSKARYWRCRKCGTRNPRTAQICRGYTADPRGNLGLRKCAQRRPKPRVAKHARTLRDDPYTEYARIAAEIHGVTDESCCCCGKPRSQERRHDRDHGHLQGSLSYGKPRGLLCVPCNRLMPRELTAERSQLVTQYLERVDQHYARSLPGEEGGKP
jgi:Recombination endonuclease VII